MTDADILKAIVAALKRDALAMDIQKRSPDQTDEALIHDCGEWLAEYVDLPAGPVSEFWSFKISADKREILARASVAYNRFTVNSANDLARLVDIRA